ncbi:unnamed protein product [Clavelina lepadiformis]|uniref:28S ribosomal protein S18a, mitochondrial n=1 Tax=Clavelina lepadiformis TaxID=159417 RepID=A0ABP0FNZ1_CLALP
MAAPSSLCCNLYLASKTLFPFLMKRILPFTCISSRNYREIQGVQDGNVITIKGVLHEDNNKNIAPRHIIEDECPLRSRGIKVTYEDVLILQQFIASTGDVLSQEETGLCQHEYFKVISCVKMAQRADLLPGPENSSNVNPDGVKLNRYLTRYPVGSRTPIRSRGMPYRKIYYKVGDARVNRDAPQVENTQLMYPDLGETQRQHADRETA